MFWLEFGVGERRKKKKIQLKQCLEILQVPHRSIDTHSENRVPVTLRLPPCWSFSTTVPAREDTMHDRGKV